MNTREIESRIKGRRREEDDAKISNTRLDIVKGVVGVSWFVALGKICSVIAEFFKTQTQYFFLLSLFLNYVSWIISLIDYDKAANKNAGKTANLIYNTLYFLFYVAITITFLVAGYYIGGMVLIVSMFVDPLVNLGRAIYFGIKSALTVDSDAERKFDFKKRSYEYGAYAGAGTLISVLFVALMMATLPLFLSIPFGLIGIGLIFAAPFIIRMFTPQRPDVARKVTPAPDIARVHETHYYDYSIATVPANLLEFRNEIDRFIDAIQGEQARAKDTILERLSSQDKKRTDKILALKFLKRIVHEVEFKPIPDQASEQEPLQLAGYLFHYKDKKELVDKISYLVLQQYPDAYQSFFKEIGHVQACFNQLFLCIMTNDTLLPRDNLRPRNAI